METENCLPMGVSLLNLRNILDNRGNLCVLHCGEDIPFEAKRIFWIYGVPEGKARGGHSHRTCDEVVVALAGSFVMVVDDGITRSRVMMDRPTLGIHIPAGVWCELSDFAPGTVCLCAASQEYIPEGYIHDYDEYRKEKGL